MKKYAILVEITGGESHDELSEDRCENLMDCRTQWNVSFQLEGYNKPYCIASTLVTRVKPERKIFSPAVIESIQRTKRRRGRRKNWKALMSVISQMEDDQWTPDCTVWRLGGRSHFWPRFDDNMIVFAEYDADQQHGYALIIGDFANALLLWRTFPHAICGFHATEEDEEMLCEKW